ncbi:DNA transposase THAP9 [Paramuricea clavata]|uniref:DNA transposase THAP9 n=1 Tax=Paramuricea clavata TaxID=317549 RepID=A0A6S7HG01_PARCT|nr:DNA transposase THAP9 [Paramuricea clavata]
MTKKEAPMNYILTYKFSQDHLELFFGAIRSSGGFNNNPTAEQFTAAYKRLLLRSSIQGRNGNCTKQDETDTLEVIGDTYKAKSSTDSNITNQMVMKQLVQDNTEIVLVVAIGTVGHFVKEDHDLVKERLLDPYDFGAYGRYEFFLYTTSVGVIIAILSLVASITGLLEKQGGTLAMAIVHAIWSLQLLVSTALLAKVLASAEKKVYIGTSTCDLLDDANHDHTCSHLISGVVFGFIGTILFLVDTIVYTKTVLSTQ